MKKIIFFAALVAMVGFVPLAASYAKIGPAHRVPPVPVRPVPAPPHPVPVAPVHPAPVPVHPVPAPPIPAHPAPPPFPDLPPSSLRLAG